MRTVGALWASGNTIITNSLSWFDPFGNFRTMPTGTNPSSTNMGFTGHRHNNTGRNDLGLIYKQSQIANARTYVPEVGRFASPDTLVPDPSNPQSFNRYSYALNNPVNLIDPSGHCAGDANNNNPFDESGGSIAHFDCTLDNFDAMSIDDRLLWMKFFMSQTGTNEWFNNIVGIIQGFDENGLATPGSWLSIVDAAILQGVQDGYASSSRRVGNPSTINPGKTEWANFFNQFSAGARTEDLTSLWGIAERTSTQHGEIIAEAKMFTLMWPNRFSCQPAMFTDGQLSMVDLEHGR